MPVVTDLSWVQLGTAFTALTGNPASLLEVRSDAYGLKLFLDLSLLLERPVDNANDLGVVEAILRLHEIAYKAQEEANEGGEVGERLNSFTPVTYGAITDGVSEIAGTVAGNITVGMLNQDKVAGRNY